MKNPIITPVPINRFIDLNLNHHPTFNSCLETVHLATIIITRFDEKISKLLKFTAHLCNSTGQTDINNYGIDIETNCNDDFELDVPTISYIEDLQSPNPKVTIAPDIHYYDNKLAEKITEQGRKELDVLKNNPEMIDLIKTIGLGIDDNTNNVGKIIVSMGDSQEERLSKSKLGNIGEGPLNLYPQITGNIPAKTLGEVLKPTYPETKPNKHCIDVLYDDDGNPIDNNLDNKRTTIGNSQEERTKEFLPSGKSLNPLRFKPPTEEDLKRFSSMIDMRQNLTSDHPRMIQCPICSYMDNLPPDVKERIRLERIKLLYRIELPPPRKWAYQPVISTKIHLIS